MKCIANTHMWTNVRSVGLLFGPLCRLG